MAPLSARRLEDSRSLPQGLSPVKTFALLCADDEPQNADIASALIEVDDFLVCPYQENELLIRLTRLFKSFPHVARSLLTREGCDQLDAVIGDGPLFRQTLHKVSLLARSKAAVVISGETGSGKELLARAIHYQSARKIQAFYSGELRCASRRVV